MTDEDVALEFERMVDGYRPYATITIVTVSKGCYRIESDGVNEYTPTAMSVIRIATARLAEQMFRQATEELKQEAYENYHKVLDSDTQS